MKKYYKATHDHRTYLEFESNKLFQLLIFWGMYLDYSETRTEFLGFSQYAVSSSINNCVQVDSVPWSKINRALNFVCPRISNQHPEIKSLRKKIKKLMFKGRLQVAMLPCDADKIIDSLSSILLENTPEFIRMRLFSLLYCESGTEEFNRCYLGPENMKKYKCSLQLFGFLKVFDNKKKYIDMTESRLVHAVAQQCRKEERNAGK